MYVKDKKK